MSDQESWPVKVFIYDISKGMARSLSRTFLGKTSPFIALNLAKTIFLFRDNPYESCSGH